METTRPEKLVEIPSLLEKCLEKSFSIESFGVETIDLGFNTPMLLPFGLVTHRPSGWLELRAKVNGEKITGYGEGVTLPEPLFTDDSGHNIAENIDSLLDSICLMETMTFSEAIDAIRYFTFPDYGRYPTARMALEMGILDVVAKSRNLSMKELFSIPSSVHDVEYGKSIGAESATYIIEQARSAIANNATKIKVKISPVNFEEVYEALQSITEETPDVDLMVDANGMFDPESTIDLAMLEKLDKLGSLVLVEEPVSRVGQTRGIDAVRLLKRALPNFKTPICLDDCLETFEDCKKVITEGLAQVINIKPGRLGSIIDSLGLIDWVISQDGQVMVGGMFEATPGRRMTTLLGAYCAFKGSSVAGDLSLAQERLVDDLVPINKQMHINSHGKIELPSGLGWGE